MQGGFSNRSNDEMNFQTERSQPDASELLELSMPHFNVSGALPRKLQQQAVPGSERSAGGSRSALSLTLMQVAISIASAVGLVAGGDVQRESGELVVSHAD